MYFSDFAYIINWWFILFIIGIIFLPLMSKVLSNFLDQGYIFAKVLGFGIITYILFLLGTLKILPFTQPAILLTLIASLSFNVFLIHKNPRVLTTLKKSWRFFFFEGRRFLEENSYIFRGGAVSGNAA